MLLSCYVVFLFIFFLRFHRAEVRGKLFVKNYKTFPARSMKFRATPSNPPCPSASKHALHPSFSCRSTISSSQQSKMSQSKLNDPTGLTCALLFLTSPHMIVPSYKKDLAQLVSNVTRIYGLYSRIKQQCVFVETAVVSGPKKAVMGHTLQGQLLENGSVVIDGYGTVTTDEYRGAVISAFYYLHEPSKLIVLALYCIVFLVAAVTNLLVIVVIFRYQHLHRLSTFK